RAQEKNLASYKKDNKFINPTADVTRLLENENNYTKQLQDINIQLQQVDYLLKYLKDKKNDKQAIPTIVGLSSESALTSSITRYNLEVAKRNQLLTTATEENPLILSANSKIEAAQKDIIEVLETLYSSINMRKSALEGVSGEFTQRASQTPAVERIYADLTRERDIKSQLYVMLLQKYEENALALAVTADNLKCIEKASTGGLVSPNRKIAYMLALFFGILFPIAFIYLTETLETKVKRLEDIEKTNKLPIVGCIPELASLKKSNKRHLVVKEGENDIMAEAFRSIRTNLHFLIQKNSGSVVMFTSSTSGEGKTFVSSNYAMSLAVMGKKVLYMGLDIRRPRLAEVFGLDPNKEGITSFLASDGSDLSMLDSYIQPSGVNNNLYLLTAGVIPPNPAELLAKDTLDKAIAYLSEKFDYLVLDTAPIGLVSDSLILSRVADAAVYVVRIKYSQKADLDYLERIVSEGKLKNTSLVVNADDMNASGARFGSRHRRYGSSYYGYGYSPDSSRKRK
ncbi:MAG: polysaccharide biosynthesis tyrosine autokinase, partial [Bacteroidaceae bacterium]|nr:polysaccharide biosynthesis tyrosine autokinase [Bacteroidaceae bacterium]